jgi:thioredoxin-like negative regulator of GroEL
MMQTILFLLGGVALVILIVQMVLLSHARKQRGRELYNLNGELGEAVRAGARVIAYFHSPSCSASRKQTPVVEKLAGEFENVFSLDIGEHCDVARAVGIHVTPTIVIIEGGEIRDVLAGARTEDLLREALL